MSAPLLFDRGNAWRWIVAIGVVGQAWASDVGTTLWRDSRWGLGWDERLAAAADPYLTVGFAAQPRRAEDGWVVRGGLALVIASDNQPGPWPDAWPDVRDGMAVSSVALDASWWRLFLRARPELRTGHRDLPTTDGDRREFIPRSTAGIGALWHVWAVGDEPVRWGPAIFGGLIQGGGDRGFPHLYLSPEEALVPLDLNGEPVWFRYEAIAGTLDDRHWGDGPSEIALRTSLRWSAVEAGLSRRWNPRWHQIDGLRTTRDEVRAGIDLGFDLGQQLRLGGEYGLASPRRRAADDRSGIDQRPMSAVGTLDWYDPLGTGELRLAGEFFWSRSLDDRNSRYLDGWRAGTVPAGSDEPGRTTMSRLLYQQRLGDAAVTVVPAWRMEHRARDERDRHQLRIDAHWIMDWSWITLELTGWLGREIREDFADEPNRTTGGGGIAVSQGH